MAARVGTLNSTDINGCKIYSLVGQKYAPEPVDLKKKRALRKNHDYLRRVDLIQDLNFETATSKIKVTPDGEYLVAAGIYPPDVKIFELRELSEKCRRRLVSEVVDFEILDNDYSKLAFLCADRSVCLHAKYGGHYSLRIPRMGRDIAYDCWSCDLLCASSSPDLYRINLEQGRFLESFTTRSQANNVVSRSAYHGLVACGGEDGAVECFDLRKKASAGRISSVSHDRSDEAAEVTALQFDETVGNTMAVGTSSGKILLYDLRSSHPILVKDHMFGSKILTIKWHQTLNSKGSMLVTADRHIVRIWDPDTGNNMTSIEPDAGSINDVCIFDNSGLMLVAVENSPIPAYFVPALGTAPKWCSYLESMTEEMEEKLQPTIYEDHTFLTKDEMERLNLTDLVGSDSVRSWLHGFLVEHHIYKKAKAKANQVDMEAALEKMKQEKLEKERISRISQKIPRLPRVNRKLAMEAHNAEFEAVDNSKSKKKKKGSLIPEIMKDPRFEKMFMDQEFEIDEESPEYLALHPQQPEKQRSLIEEHFDPVANAEQDPSDSDVSDQNLEDASGDYPGAKNQQAMRLYEVKDERHAEAFLKRKYLEDDSLPIGDRVAELEKRQASGASTNVKIGPGGSREITYNTKFGRNYKDESDEEEPNEHKNVKRRGIQSLGIKIGKSEFYASGGPNRRGRGGGGRGRGRGRRGKSRGGSRR